LVRRTVSAILSVRVLIFLLTGLVSKNSMTLLDIINSQQLLIILWLLYFSIHSLSASLWLKQRVADRFPNFMPGYRLSFNVIALLALVPPLYLMYRYPGENLWQWSGGWQYLSYLASIIALGGFLWSLRYYKISEFLGTSQLKEGRKDILEQEQFYLSPLHHYVRHPWYSLALLYIWSRDMNESFFVTASLISIYFIIGSRLEETKLIAYHGQQYRLYRQQVAALIPLPWRILSKKQAEKITGMT